MSIHKKPEPHRREVIGRKCMQQALLLIAALLGGVTVAGLFGQSVWLLELLTHFRPHYAGLLVLCTALLLLFRKFGPAAACLFFAGLNVYLAWPYLDRPPDRPPVSATPLRLMSVNLNHNNTEPPGLAQLIDTERPHILLLLEYTPTHQKTLAPLVQSFTTRIVAPQPGGFGIALFSRLPLYTPGTFRLADVDAPQIQAQLQWNNRPITLLGLHLLSPELPAGARGRNRQLAALAERVSAVDDPRVVLGDFNITPWSPYYDRFVEKTRLLAGYYPATWPVPFNGLGIPIDHCLHSRELTVIRQYRGPSIGSDHYPLVVHLDWRHAVTPLTPDG